MNWIDTQLGQVAEPESGFGFPRESQGKTDGEFPFYKVSDMNAPANHREMNRAANYVSAELLRDLCGRAFPRGTVIFPKIGAAIATGKKRILSCPATYDNNVMGLVPNDLVVPEFLYYWSLQFDFVAISNKGPVPSIRKSEVQSLPFKLPTQSEQRRIVEILDQADALRQQRADTDAKVQRILPALFHKMFGDPDSNPKGWPVKPLGEAIVDMRYGTSAKCEASANGLPVLRIPNVVRGEIDLSDLKYADLTDDEVNRILLQKGDVLFVRTNGNRDYVGRCAVFDRDERCLFASYLIRSRFDPDKFSPLFLTAYLATPTGRRAMSPVIRTTAGQSNISTAGLRQIPVPRPPLELQQDFERCIRDVRSLMRQQAVTGVGINHLFDVLLHRAFTGELTAKWREAHRGQLEREQGEQLRVLQQSSRPAPPPHRERRTQTEARA